MEAQQNENRRWGKPFQHGHFLQRRSDVCGHLVGRFLGLLEPALRHASECQKVQVMAVIHQRINAGCARAPDIVPVDFGAALVRLGGSLIIARLQKDVRRHVDQMTCGRDQAASQSFGARQGPFRSGRRFHRVDVVMVCPDVERVASQHRFKDPHDLHGALRRLAIRSPELPGAQVHHAFGIESRGVQIVGVTLDHITHGILVIHGQFL